MPTVESHHLIKSFGAMRAVDDVSFDVNQGEILALLGPNGAGKTTTIRILLDIFKPDQGNVSIFNGPMTEEKKNRIGYMPEERGLYQDIQLDRCLVYLATLKGLPTGEARKRINLFLERFDLAEHKKKKLKELSKGMQQKAQLIVTLVHDPELLIIDEPFSALDPINTQMVKDLLREERAKGKTIVMCTHQMNQVEELCDRLVLIDHGQTVLYGSLGDIRRQFTSRDVLVRAAGDLPVAIPGVEKITPHNGLTKLILTPEATPQTVLRELVNLNVNLEQYEIAIPSLDEIFIQVVQGKVQQA